MKRKCEWEVNGKCMMPEGGWCASRYTSQGQVKCGNAPVNNIIRKGGK